MNMSNTTPADIEATNVTTPTSWQELVPFLRTGDIVTIHYGEDVTMHGARVRASDKTPLITAGERYLRYSDGALSEAVTDVVLQRVVGRADELEPIATSLKTGDVVRATFVVSSGFFRTPHAITLEGAVETDRNGDTFLTAESADGGTPEFYSFTFFGSVPRRIRALEVISRAEDDEDDEDVEEIIEDITGEERIVDMTTPEGRLAAFDATPLGTRVSATYAGLQFDGVLGTFDGDFAIMNEDGGRAILWLTEEHEPDMRVQDITFHEDESEATPKREDAAPLTFSDYAARAAETAVYPGAGTFWGLQYVTAGLASEAGEVQGKITKMQRDGGYTPESSTFWGGDRADLVAELGDVAWYLAMACLEADINPNEVLRRNLSKLADRAARDTIQGSGDNR